MRIIGLTGGIASGKSTVARMLAALGARIIDADQLAREVVEPGTPGLEELSRRFPGVVDPGGKLDRKALGERVFASPSERKSLEAILHPRIREAFLAQTEQLQASGVDTVLYDVPLLFENGLDLGMNGTIVVFVPRSTQLSRLAARDGLTREQAEARLAAQLPIEEKAKKATWLIDNTGTLEQTRAQVERLWKTIMLPPQP